ncbi:MAG TPA: hypothetical protein VKT28_08695 [Puia sp.]|nr:hypothetical protein [Puia sp.]
MKPHAATQQTMPGPLPKPIKSNSYRATKITSHSVPPPDEETLQRLNAMVKEYPFCIYYREKKNDPL